MVNDAGELGIQQQTDRSMRDGEDEERREMFRWQWRKKARKEMKYSGRKSGGNRSLTGGGMVGRL